MASGRSSSGVREFEALLAEGEVREVILATNSDRGRRGDRALPRRARAARAASRASRIAHGVPVGGELEYVDGGTLAHALAGRQSL